VTHRRGWGAAGLTATVCLLVSWAWGCVGLAEPYPAVPGPLRPLEVAGLADPPRDLQCPASLGQLLIEAANAVRAERGLRPVHPHPSLVRVAEDHSGDQAARGRVTHLGPGGASLQRRVDRRGYVWVRLAENVGAGYPSPVEMVAAWLTSPAHEAVLLAPDMSHVGVGYGYGAEWRLRHYWTLVVGQPGPAEPMLSLRCHP
jgi:uncharacterized protein YkwD